MIFSVQVPLPALPSKPESGLAGLKLALVTGPACDWIGLPASSSRIVFVKLSFGFDPVPFGMLFIMGMVVPSGAIANSIGEGTPVMVLATASVVVSITDTELLLELVT